jgi:hypothetical protein
VLVSALIVAIIIAKGQLIGGIALIALPFVLSLPQSELRQELMGLYAGIAGISAASYGNQLLGQMLAGTVIYQSIVLRKHFYLFWYIKKKPI